MSILTSVVLGLDRLGLRRAIAPLASLSRRFRTGGRQTFSVSPEGYWINRDGEAVIVSPEIHTAPFAAYEHWVLDNWTWDYRPKAGDTVIDIGAGVGEEAVVFSRLVSPTGRVVSIEAHPRTFDCLEATIARSKLSGVAAKWCAISNVDGVAKIEDDDSYIGNSIVPAAQGSVEVPARSLDSVVDELDIDRIDLLRMNIEGAERLALDGMTECSAKCWNIVVSCHDFIADRGGSDQFRTFDVVRQKLEGFGFEVRVRSDHAAPWVRYYAYGRRAASAG